jgi:glutamate:Na+ symporter, ESS family
MRAGINARRRLGALFALSELETLIVGLTALFIASRIRNVVSVLKRAALPDAVLGALFVALFVLLAHLLFATEIKFAGGLKDLLLLVFFTTIGLSARFRLLAAGGWPLMIFCAVIVLLIITQNIIGIGVALAWGAHPFYGLLAGGLSFVGGPGTALAWAKEAEAAGLLAAQPVGVGAATLATLTGALLSGPIVGLLIRRTGLKGEVAGTADVSFANVRNDELTSSLEASPDVNQILSTLLAIAIAVYLGDQINAWAKNGGVLLPGFLSCLIAGILITNAGDALGWDLNLPPAQKAGEIALNLFLVMSLMSIPLAAVGSLLLPLAINTLAQMIVIIAIAFFVLFPLLGRDYDAAVATGGFIGFGVASMPVAMATMDEIGRRYGPSPKAFLLVTLAGSFFVDLANAMVAKLFLLLPIFRFD